MEARCVCVCVCVCTQTNTLSAELLSYSPDLHVFGYMRLNFAWRPDGSVVASATLTGLPALDYLNPETTWDEAWNEVCVCVCVCMCVRVWGGVGCTTVLAAAV